MSPPSPRLCIRTAPHGDSVLSVAFSSQLILASGGEDSALLLHDLRFCSSSTSSEEASTSSSTSAAPAARPAARALFADAVAALAWQGEHVLYLGSGNSVLRVDTRRLGGGTSSGGAAAGSASVVVGACNDEVSSLSVSRDGRVLAVADDSGAVSLLDLSRADGVVGEGGGEARQGEQLSLASSVAALSVAAEKGSGRPPPTEPEQQQRFLLPSRRLPRPHAGSLATAVAFRPGRSGESLVSGGCDCSLARWDCCSGRLVRRWHAREITTAGEDDEGEEIEGEKGAGTTAEKAPAATSRVFNPPFVHALAAPPTSADKPWSGCVAAALGDGSVAVLDCEARGEEPRRQQRRHPKSGDKTRNNPSSSLSPLISPPPAPFSGVLAVLRPEEGGHSAAATCVAFVGEGGERGSAPLVASGGDDGRLLFWGWAESVAEIDNEGAGGRRQQQLPAAWEAALPSPRRRALGGGCGCGGDRGEGRPPLEDAGLGCRGAAALVAGGRGRHEPRRKGVSGRVRGGGGGVSKLFFFLRSKKLCHNFLSLLLLFPSFSPLFLQKHHALSKPSPQFPDAARRLSQYLGPLPVSFRGRHNRPCLGGSPATTAAPAADARRRRRRSLFVLLSSEAVPRRSLPSLGPGLRGHPSIRVRYWSAV